MTEAFLESEIVKFIRFYWEDCFIYIKTYLEKPNEFKQYLREIKPKWDSPKPFDWYFAQEDKKFDVAYIDGLINQFIRQNNLSKAHQIKLLNEVLADFELKKGDFSCYDKFLIEDYVEINYKVELQYIKVEVNNTIKHLKEKLEELNKGTESKPAYSIMAEKREELRLKGLERDKQNELNRIKCHETCIDKEYNYSPTLEDFKEELTIIKLNKSTNEYLLFLRETKKIYKNANYYYIVWGARGTGIDRGELYEAILKLIQSEIESELKSTAPQQTESNNDAENIYKEWKEWDNNQFKKITNLKGQLIWLNSKVDGFNLINHKIEFLTNEKEKVNSFIINRIKLQSKHPDFKVTEKENKILEVAQQFFNEIEKILKTLKPQRSKQVKKGKTNSGKAIKKLLFDYSNDNNYFFSNKIDDFKTIETELVSKQYVNENGEWQKDKMTLVAFIHIIVQLGYVRPKITGKEKGATLIAYRRFFEERYKTDIREQMKPSNFEFAKLKNYKPDFRFIPDIDNF